MKKFFFAVIICFSFVFFSSFKTIDNGGIVEDKFYVDDLSIVQDEAEISMFDLEKGGPAVGGVCPGTGTLCIIKMVSTDDDGDPTYFLSYKGKGRANIEVK